MSISNKSGIGAIFATTRCRVIACSIEQRQQLALSLQPTPQFAFTGGNSSLPVKSTGAIILSCKKYPVP
ncbi:MAG: hypothetical protein JSU83_03655 [Deltaproteobacteria bacterium]|nr:MAG: hypothetical protein JSU83_03655 [Deltaproteobacteria bacterium]